MFCLTTFVLIPLVGCQGHKVIARVNGVAINEEEFADRTQRVSVLAANTDAGGTALVGMIREKLTTQLAAEKHASPTPEAVSTYANYLRESITRVDDEMKAGRVTDQDLKDNARFQMEEFGIGTDGAKVDEAKLKTEYETNKKQLVIPERWVVRTLTVPDAQTGQTILDELKKTGNFEKAARQLGISPTDIPTAVRENSIPVPNITDIAFRDTLAKLNPGQFTDKPVQVNVPQSQQLPTGRVVLIIAQMIRKKPGRDLSLADVRTILERNLIAKEHPQWEQHKNQMLAEFTAKADLQINIERYKPLIANYIKPQAEANTATAPGGSLGSPSSGGMAPPPSGGQ